MSDRIITEAEIHEMNQKEYLIESVYSVNNPSVGLWIGKLVNKGGAGVAIIHEPISNTFTLYSEDRMVERLQCRDVTIKYKLLKSD